ncbi:ABC transporter ATP-binding protein [Mumia zhuanghuii]|uniref:Spermidine/putrescine import ATP-binding protein PotA n=1 Tax=Mumia zhuanghuii TaxID=2585211 RepID=A0A5C4N3X7_9ACTN|nr:ABC transporter ATP-binding protein [Mumia zhuanghuii]TNC35678.1 ABC transporter ATP-binding protein [Mumia zhuanghuii]TNC51705.1 ABC transporter ATP-binding protein [Mumia zhuanghuii]
MSDTHVTIPSAAKAPPTRAPLVELRHVTRRFGDVTALDDVSLTIAENEFFALLGPSGCGKTTLLRAIAGFEQPDSGEMRLGGEDLVALPPHRRPLNLMFQSYALFPHMSVERNVAYGLEQEKLAKSEIRQRVGEVLETVGLSALASRKPHQLSGGQRQRVALARAVVKRPKLLLLDEPLSALDRKVRSQMQLELKRLQQEVGITFVVVTHDQEEAMSMADRLAVLAHGRVQQVATPVEIYRRPANLFVADFIGDGNRFAGRVVDGGIHVDSVGLLPGHLVNDVVGEAHLVVRPEETRLGAPGAGLLDGRVVETQFYGGVSTVAVEVPDHADPVLCTITGVSTVERGAEVSLTWTSDTAVVVGGTL